ncbi:hypothetical protein [Corynebacterium lizhenjunii]|uniref:hypothetical protein n=1 Tax=Corynebacterium lizhenjunii TaxID=2709394 RepID=UPI0013EB6911|nr:hypothetical protein [Corynebacterium lizhenjunii]
MKFFSRKAFIATATAAAVAFGGTTVATAETTDPTPVMEPSNGATPTNTEATPNTTTPAKNSSNSGSSKDANKDEKSSIKDVRPQDITAWITVFTTVLAALGTLMTFMSKHFNLPIGK